MRQVTNVLLLPPTIERRITAMLRAFKDSTGVEWRVWEVFPSKASPLTRADNMSRTSLRETPFANGWLCFESSDEKRRLAPIPPEWEVKTHREIEVLWHQATPVPKRSSGPRLAVSESRPTAG